MLKTSITQPFLPRSFGLIRKARFASRVELPQEKLSALLQNGPRFAKIVDVRLVSTKAKRGVGRQQDAVRNFARSSSTEVPIASS